MPDDDYPSDYDADDLESMNEKTVSVDMDEEDASIRDELKRELILLASVTNRGMCASAEEKNLLVDLVTQLEVRYFGSVLYYYRTIFLLVCLCYLDMDCAFEGFS